MSDFDALQQRMDLTAEQLAAAMAGRHQETRTLMETLGRLEQRFKEREEVLNTYRALTAPMEQENLQLCGLLDRLLSQLDGNLGAGPSASVSKDLNSSAAEAGPAPDPDDGAMDAAMPEPDDMAATAPPVELFEDVAPGLLMEEERRESALESSLPSVVQTSADESQLLDESELASMMPEDPPGDAAEMCH